MGTPVGVLLASALLATLWADSLFFPFVLMCHLSNQTMAYPDSFHLLHADLAQVPGASWRGMSRP